MNGPISHNLGTGAERHLGFGFGSIQCKSIHESGENLGSFGQVVWSIKGNRIGRLNLICFKSELKEYEKHKKSDTALAGLL